jgi:hypothetical protein
VLSLSAFQGSYLHFSLVAAGFFAFTLYFLIKRLREMLSQLHRKRNPPAPFQPSLLHQAKIGVAVWSTIAIFGLLLLALAYYLSHFQFLSTKVDLLGEATLRSGTVHFTRYDGAKLTYGVEGTQAAAGGIFLRFPKWMSHLGLENYHRLITFRGNGENEYHYKEPPDSWIKENSDPFYSFLYSYRKYLEFLQLRYTESPYFTGSKRKIFVTHSGYIVQ